jgi:hypothetical protein
MFFASCLIARALLLPGMVMEVTVTQHSETVARQLQPDFPWYG